MMYQNFQTYTDSVAPLRSLANMAAAGLTHSLPGISRNVMHRAFHALYEVIARAGLSHRRPAFGIDQVEVASQPVAVREVAVHRTPFCTLLRFAKDIPAPQPRVLLVAPMSGHFATLLRGTVRTMLAEHDVYITDWHNARDVPLSQGRFGFNEFVQHVIDFTETIGPSAHLLAVCQPTVAALAA